MFGSKPNPQGRLEGAVVDYPLAIRETLRAAAELGVASRVLDPRSGWLIRLEHGGARVHVLPNSFPINDSVASSIARDKVFTYRLCAEAGLRVPAGACFHTGRYPKHAVGQGIDEALAYAERVGFPLVLKPNRLTKGRHVQLVRDRDALERALDRLSEDDHMFILQEQIFGDEYRVMILDDALLLAYARSSAKLVGDGERTIAELIRALTGGKVETNQDALAWLRARGVGPETVLPTGERLHIEAMNRNINAGGEVVDATATLPPALLEAARVATRAVGLRIAGVDAIVDSRGPVILEVNSKPTINGYFRQLIAHRDRVSSAYRAIVRAMFSLP